MKHQLTEDIVVSGTKDQVKDSFEIVKSSEEEATTEKFLYLIGNDMENNPQNIYAVPHPYWTYIGSLTAGVDVDLNKPICDE